MCWGALGWRSRKATKSASSRTTSLGISPLAILQNMQSSMAADYTTNPAATDARRPPPPAPRSPCAVRSGPAGPPPLRRLRTALARPRLQPPSGPTQRATPRSSRLRRPPRAPSQAPSGPSHSHRSAEALGSNTSDEVAQPREHLQSPHDGISDLDFRHLYLLALLGRLQDDPAPALEAVRTGRLRPAAASPRSAPR